MSTKLKIDLSLGIVEVEGEESFVGQVYADFKERLLAQSKVKTSMKAEETFSDVSLPSGGLASYETLAECITAAHAKTDAEYSLVASAYLQSKENCADFTAQRVNKALSHTGHGVSNITDALQTNIDQSPQLVIQIAKSGKSRQARKKYKVTDAGLEEVKRMISSNGEQAG